ncbi:MAG TPA: Xaa-Pro peptidase family protein [Candidatus Bathyarchaeia archaeon]|nr:Xaa-Pro peptidase family protein [Candidatus Bathyarchaeia archaeon]
MAPYGKRKKQIQELMAAKGVDAMLIAGAENYYYITGDYRRQARMLFYRDADPTIIVFQPEVEQVRARTWVNDIRGWSSVDELMRHFFNAMRERDLGKATVGFDTHSAPGFEVFRFRKLNPKIAMVENDDIISELRMVKSADEIARMKKAAQVAERGMMAAATTLAAGTTENDVAAEAEYAMRKAGSERLGFLTFVNSGERSLGLHGFVSHRLINAGDPVIVDLHPVTDLYASDMARTFVCTAEASGLAATAVSPEFIKLAHAYDEAQQGVIDVVKPGWKVKDVTQFMVKSIKQTEFGKYVVPGYIHGVGLEAEEYPHPSHYPQHGEIVLKPNMTVSVGHAVLAAPGIGGYRKEDVVRITESGCQVLTKGDGLPGML